MALKRATAGINFSAAYVEVELLPSEELTGQLTRLTDRKTYLEVTSQVLMSLIPCDLIDWNAIDAERRSAEVASSPADALDHDPSPDLIASLSGHPIVLSYAAEPRGGLSVPRGISW